MSDYCGSCGSTNIRTLGLSAFAIRARQLGQRAEMHHPWDPSDLGRCLKWLGDGDISIMRGASPAWDALVDNWDEIVATYREEEAEATGRASRTYEAMKAALSEVDQ